MYKGLNFDHAWVDYSNDNYYKVVIHPLQQKLIEEILNMPNYGSGANEVTPRRGRRPAAPAQGLTGVLYQIVATRRVGSYTITDFIVQTDSGPVNVSSFSTVNPELLGQNVRLSVTESSQYGLTLARGTSIEPVESYVGSEQLSNNREEAVTIAAPARRGRPRRIPVNEGTRLVNANAVPNGEAPAFVDATQSEPSGREAYRSEAERAAETNLRSAIAVGQRLNLNLEGEALIALADLVGRTQTALFLDSQKTERMQSFSRR